MTSPLFTADALAPLRAIHKASLVSRALIQARHIATGGQGGANTGAASWATIDGGEAVPCRLSPLVPGTPGATSDQTTSVTKWEVGFDLDTPELTSGMRLTITGNDLTTGTAWSRVVMVTGARSPRTFSTMRVYSCNDASPAQRA